MLLRSRKEPRRTLKPFLLANSKQTRLSFRKGHVKLPTNVPCIEYSTLKKYLDEKNENRCLIEKGGYGEVVKGFFDGKDVAVKVMIDVDTTACLKTAFENELNVMAAVCGHPNIVRLFGYIVEPRCLVMEYVQLGDVFNMLYVEDDPEIKATFSRGKTKKKILLGIANGMNQLHAINVVHGDLKPENILITEGWRAKIADFGNVTVSSDRENSTEWEIVGSKHYMAPELADGKKLPQLACDVYSFGITMNEIIQEEIPYSDVMLKTFGKGSLIDTAINSGAGMRPRIDVRTPVAVASVIKKCWRSVAKQRPSFREVFRMLRCLDVPNSFRFCGNMP